MAFSDFLNPNPASQASDFAVEFLRTLALKKETS
jgi:hypothetical protein